MNTSITLRRSLAVALLALAPAGLCLAESKPAAAEASIPFANHGGIRDWQADSERGLWVQANNRKWYYAKFMGPCSGLAFATSLGFDTSPQGSFDRWSSVVVPGRQRCTVQTFVPSKGPPKKKKANATAAPHAPQP